jgi:hypothetical protein
MAYNHENRFCDWCNGFFHKGELKYAGIVPNKGHAYICQTCNKERKERLSANRQRAKAKKALELLKESQPTLF